MTIGLTLSGTGDGSTADGLGDSSVKPRVMTPQSSVNFPKTHLETAQDSAKQYKKRVMRAVFALLTVGECVPR